MRRLGELDLPERLSPHIPAWATQLLVAAACLIGMWTLRTGFDLIFSGSAPFALVYPFIILATLFAGWQAGALTAIVSILYAWRVIFPMQVGIQVSVSAGNGAAIVVALVAALTIFIAESFRLAVRHAVQERDREIADRDLFLSEFDHRMKNNFAIVQGLLEMQQRRAESPAIAAALESARLRVDSIAQAHRHLYRGSNSHGAVEMRDYLRELCGALAEALFPGGQISLVCDAAEASVPRDRAVSIGLVVNELVTNAAKHAFRGRESGRITVCFRNRPEGWRLEVADDGIGMAQTVDPLRKERGLGTRLIDAFARQAGGRLTSSSDATGTRVTLDIAA